MNVLVCSRILSYAIVTHGLSVPRPRLSLQLENNSCAHHDCNCNPILILEGRGTACDTFCANGDLASSPSTHHWGPSIGKLKFPSPGISMNRCLFPRERVRALVQEENDTGQSCNEGKHEEVHIAG